MSIGENIKALRIKHNLTQAELGEIAHVSDKAVSSWEKDNAVPRMGAIERMAAYFGVSKSDIIEDIDDVDEYYLDKEAAEIAQELLTRPELKVLFKASRNVSAEDLKIVQAMVDTLAKKDDE